MPVQVSDRSNAIPKQPTLVAGVDASSPDARGWAVGAVALLSLPDLEVVAVRRAMVKVERLDASWTEKICSRYYSIICPLNTWGDVQYIMSHW